MKIVNIESFPIRVSNNSDKGRKINTKNINTAMLWKGDRVDYDGSHCQAPPEGAQC